MCLTPFYAGRDAALPLLQKSRGENKHQAALYESISCASNGTRFDQSNPSFDKYIPSFKLLCFAPPFTSLPLQALLDSPVGFSSWTVFMLRRRRVLSEISHAFSLVPRWRMCFWIFSTDCWIRATTTGVHYWGGHHMSQVLVMDTQNDFSNSANWFLSSLRVNLTPNRQLFLLLLFFLTIYKK